MKILARLAALMLGLVGALSAVSPATALASGWAIAPSPTHHGCGLSRITKVPRHAGLWAVGDCYSVAPLVEHRTGGEWVSVALASPAGATHTALFGVAAASADDVWAVGYYAAPGGGGPLIEHWDGNAWSEAASPNVGSGLLDAIAVSSPDNVWAIGIYTTPGQPTRPLVEHWNGSTWSLVTVPTTHRSAWVGGITVVPGTNHPWVFGSHATATRDRSQPLVLHRGSKGWVIVPVKNLRGIDSRLTDGVITGGPGHRTVWAVGANGGVERLSRSGWEFIPGAVPGATLHAIARIPGSRQLWAVGGMDDGFGHAVTERWRHGVWQRIPNPSHRAMSDVVATSRADAWAVGGYGAIYGTGTALILQYRGR